MLSGGYCSACGQKGDVGIPSLGHLLGEALGDIFNFDSRLWRSLATLAFKPGRLTNLYLAGQRVRFTPPFRMYVITSVVFFVLFSLLRPESEPAEAVTATDDTATELGAAPEIAPDVEPATDEGVPTGLSIIVDDDDLECTFNSASVSPALRERLDAACERVEAKGSASLEQSFTDNIPVMMLVFIPIAAAIMKLLYLFAGRKYVEHVLFFAHVHTLFFLLATATLLLAASMRVSWVPDWPVRGVIAAVWLYFLVYVYLAMRRVYEQSHALTAVKYVVLGGSYVLALVLTLMVTLIVTAFTL